MRGHLEVLLPLAIITACSTVKEGAKPAQINVAPNGDSNSGDANPNGGDQNNGNNPNGTDNNGNNSGNGPGPTIDPNAKDSVSVFGRTVFPLASQWCVACHAQIQTPFFAQSTVKNAHDIVMLRQLVDFDNIPNSRLVLRLLKDKHNCPNEGCESAGQKMIDAITAWHDVIKEETSDTPQLPTSGTQKFADSKVTTVPGNNPAGVMLIEAETATLRAPMVKTALATASGGSILETPANAGRVVNVNQATNSQTLGTATMTVNITTAGNYRVQGYVNGIAMQSSFYVRFDGGTLAPWVFTPTAATTYMWSTAAPTANGTPTQFNLTAGAHTFEIRQREAAAKIDKIVLSSVPTFDPASAEPATRDIRLLTFDLSDVVRVPGTKLTVELEDASATAYVFKNPSLVVPTGSIYAKDLRLLVNGEFSAQNATFTVVDKTVAAPGGVLMKAAMVVLKDKGNDVDQFSFAFGTLEAK